MATAWTARRLFTADEYHRMAESGILLEDDPVELIGGEIVEMSPIGGRHVWSVGQFARLVTPHCGDRFRVNVQSPISLGVDTEPQPDIAVVRERGDYPLGALPEAADVILLVEVADSSLAYDRRVKLPLYARAGIPEVFLADLVRHGLERHSDPAGGFYRQVVRAERGEALESRALPGLVFDVDDLLGS